MKKLTLVLAAGALLATSGAAFATATPAQQCTKLEKQFDAAIKKHGTAAKAADAKQARADGGDLCKAGKPEDGVKKLQEALQDIGVKPHM
jgi:hypothetical protein